MVPNCIVLLHFPPSNCCNRDFLCNLFDDSLSYRADWEPAATSGRRVLGVFWRCPVVLWGPSTPNPTQTSWKTLILKRLADSYCVMWICGGFAPHGPSALLATKNASSGIKTCHLAIPRIMGQKIADFEKYRFLFFFPLHGSKSGALGQKNGDF